MPCDVMVKSAAERAAREEALRELAEDLQAGRRRVARNVLTGKVSISSWAGSSAKAAGWCEGCAVQAIEKRGWATKAQQTGAARSKSVVVLKR
jgi:hypothetical protein